MCKTTIKSESKKVKSLSLSYFTPIFSPKMMYKFQLDSIMYSPIKRYLHMYSEKRNKYTTIRSYSRRTGYSFHNTAINCMKSISGIASIKNMLRRTTYDFIRGLI